jgi:hypothetical protein
MRIISNPASAVSLVSNTLSHLVRHILIGFVRLLFQAESRSQQPVLKSIEDFNKKNPNAATALNAVLSEARPTSTVKSDGTASCLNKGCQKDYRVIDNHHGACR